jgi:K(+)-stimulated pyrophosphate-energized sodium pump
VENLYYLIPLSGVLAVVFGLMRSSWISKQNPGNEKMQEIGLAIREGATAFLVREYKVLTVFVLTVAALLYWVNMSSNTTEVAFSFVVGAICSGLAGALGMRIATLANHRTTEAARTSLSKALSVAFNGGVVMGMNVVGLGILGLSLLFFLYGGLGNSPDFSLVMTKVSGFAMGASSIALFARVGGGIYTKAADVGADLVGKVEAVIISTSFGKVMSFTNKFVLISIFVTSISRNSGISAGLHLTVTELSICTNSPPSFTP